MLRTVLAAVLVAALSWLGTSVGGALTAPGTDSTAARLAEWGRTHHLGWAVNELEQARYQVDKPKTGGTVAGGVPTIRPLQTGHRGSAAPARPHRSTRAPGAPASSRPRPTATPTGPRLAAAPAPIRPFAHSQLAREGQWQDLFQVNGHPAARVAFLRPDPVHTSYLVNVVWMDPNLVRFELFPGYQVPGPPLTAPDELSGANRRTVLATFNSGFRMIDAHGGYWQNGRTIKPLRTGAASMVLTKDGRLSVRAWPGGAPGPQVAAVRQNLTMLIQGGRVSPLVDSPSTSTWGATVGNRAYVWRTGIGIRADGTVVFVVGPALNVQTLAAVLQRAGAVDAMELDINPTWTNYLLYTHPAPGTAVPHRLGADGIPSTYRYLQPSTRDFVGVFPR